MDRIQAASLPLEVAKRIREMIRKGALKKGDRIIESALCQSMGVSRTPLREALRVLNSEGLVELIPNKGSYVAQPSINDIGEMFYVMSLLEGACARICAKKLTSESLKALDDLCRQLEQYCEKEDRENYMAVNQRYHSLVQELAGNKVLLEIINGLRQKILLYRYRQIYEPNRLLESMKEHHDLQEAFRERNSAAAERCMKKHLNRQFQALKSAHEGSSNRPAPETRRKTRGGRKEKVHGV